MARTTIEECLSLDLDYLEKQDLLRPGIHFSLSWTDGRTANSEPSSVIDITVMDGQIQLSYRCSRSVAQDVGPQTVNEPIALEHNDPGGYLAYFLCPRCDRRARKLHMPPEKWLFGCRACYDLGYRSQAERRSLLDRVTAKEDRPRRKPRLKRGDIEAWQAYLTGGDISRVDPSFARLIRRIGNLRGRLSELGMPSKMVIWDRREQELLP